MMMRCFDQIRFIPGRVLLFCVVGSIGASLLTGCPSTTSASKMSSAEKANFEGGPMPADFKPNVGSGPPKSVPPK